MRGGDQLLGARLGVGAIRARRPGYGLLGNAPLATLTLPLPPTRSPAHTACARESAIVDLPPSESGMDDSAGVIYRLGAGTRCSRGRGRRRGSEMTFREAVEINTRLHGGEAVPTSQRMALAW